MSLFWDRQNQPIEDTLVWARLYEDDAYRQVAFDEDTASRTVVSTIWEGLDLNRLLEPTAETVAIFETAVFVDGDMVARRPANLEVDALEGHRSLVNTYLPHRLLPGAERLLGSPPMDGPDAPDTTPVVPR